MKGCIFNIQKYCIHDGPGIRTTVFLKGCSLSCSWCHNPESQSFQKEVMIFPSRCDGCGSCIDACSVRALRLGESGIERDRDLCTLCEACATECYFNAIRIVGREISAKELVHELKKDIIFYESSGGGITISGGEPLAQPEFVLELLRLCKEQDINTALDTSGFGDTEGLMKLAAYTDLFLYDIKLMDNEKHKRYVGISNERILENLKCLSRAGKKLWLRIPVIPDINDDEDNINAIAELIGVTAGIAQVNLLPYHNISGDKYKRLDKKYSLEAIKTPEAEHMQKIADMFQRAGVNVLIGG